jgi:hypothetical protein
VDKTATELRRSGYFDVRMLETLATNWGVKRQDATKKKRRTEGTTAAQEEDGCFEVYFCFFLGKFRASLGCVLFFRDVFGCFCWQKAVEFSEPPKCGFELSKLLLSGVSQRIFFLDFRPDLR